MLIKEIVDFENFFHKEFYKSKKNVKQLCKDTGFSSAKITHWLDIIGPEVKFLDVLKMSKALGFYVSIEKIGEVNIPSVWVDYPNTVTSGTTSNVTDGSVVTIPASVQWQHRASDIRVDNQLKVLKKAKKSNKKGK